MKILAIVSTIDLRNKLGCTPAWWQLLKALYEIGHDVIVVPYLGNPVESPWWRTYNNPCARESILYNSYLDLRKKAGKEPAARTFLTPFANVLIHNYVKPKWYLFLTSVLSVEKDIDFLLFMSVPLTHFTGIPTKIRERFGVPAIYYDGDMPTILPQYTVSRGFKFNYYEGANLYEYDAFFSNSKGCIGDLEAMGARNVKSLYYGIDPELAAPLDIQQDIDISFFGYGSDFREEWMEKLISIPSRQMQNVKFAVAGGGFKIDMGRATLMGDLSYSQWRHFACRSKINLNITRWSHTRIYASSTSRPFELASFGSCIVSQPYEGIQEWFNPGTELLIAGSSDEATALYRQLLSDKDRRLSLSQSARARVLKEHTYRHRAAELLHHISEAVPGIIKSCGL